MINIRMSAHAATAQVRVTSSAFDKLLLGAA